MDITDLVLLSFALGLDCFIVSFSQGLIINSNRRINSLKLAAVMGLFQGLMPVIGYVATNKIYNLVVPYTKWLVFTIFFILGLNFILESLKRDVCDKIQCLDLKCLISLGFATSIDALISGANLKLTHSILWLACIIIGAGSCIMSQLGFWSGNFIKNICPKFLHILGGVILMALAMKSVL